MATISAYKQGATHHVRSNAKVPYVAEWDLDFSKTAVATGDVVETLYVPKGSVILFAGAEVMEVTGSAVTFTVGTGADADQYVASGDANVAGYSTSPAGAGTALPVFAAADTIDVTVTGAPTKGRIRVFAVMTSVEEVPAGTIAKAGS